MKKLGFWVLAVFVFLGITSLAFAGGDKEKSQGKKQLVVAFSQMETNYPWRIEETRSIKDEAAKRGIKLIYTDAEGSTAKQVSDVEDLIVQKPDYILLAPREYEGLAPALQSAKKAGIPVILIDRDAAGVPGEDYVTCITADFVWEGYMGGKLLAEQFKGKDFNVVEIIGTPGSSVARDRSIGLKKAAEEFPFMHIIASQTGNFNRAEAQKAMENIIQAKGEQIDAVYGHCDESAIGAMNALLAAGPGFVPGKDVLITGCAGEKDALQKIIDGQMFATVECSPRFGPVAFDVIEKLERGEKVPTWIKNPGKVYDSSNAKALFHEGF